VTCDVARVTAGRAAFGLLLSKVGKIQSDFYLLARGAELLLAFAPGTLAAAAAELERMLVMEDAEIESLGDSLACLAVHGPRAFELASDVVRDEASAAGALDRTGLGGAVVLAPAPALPGLESALVSRGAVLATDDAWRTLRLERGLGVFGVDYTTADNAHEAGLDRAAISWTKGCYLGQEVVFMQDARGKLKRRLVLLGVEGPVPEPGTAVIAPGGDAVGEVTSAAHSQALGSALVLARVRAPHFEAGTGLIIGDRPAVVRS
jgi:hypothetical protein